MTQVDPIQAQLIAARRSQILDAATKVFGEKGFHQTTIKDIAKEAGIADGTIYNYFENKMALMLGILDRLNETPERGEHFSEAAPGNIREWASAYIKHRYGMFNPEVEETMRAVLPELMIKSELRQLYMQKVIEPTYVVAEQYFQRWIDEGIVRPMDAKLTLRLMSGMFLGPLMLRMLGDPELEKHWDEVPDLLTEFILDGLMPGEQKLGGHDDSSD